MLPSIKKLDNIELIRDGGSLAATFETDDNGRYILFFKIDDENLSSHKLKSGASYRAPVVIDTDPKKRATDTDKIVYSELSGPAILISWDQARDILSVFRSLSLDLTSLQAQWLEKMSAAAANDGRLD